MNVVGSQHQHCVQQEQPQQHTPNCTHARLSVYLCVSWLLRTLRTRPRLDARLRIPHTVCSVRFNSKISCGEKILSAGFLRARAFVCVCARSSKGGECTKCAGLDLHLQGRRTEREGARGRQQGPPPPAPSRAAQELPWARRGGGRSASRRTGGGSTATLRGHRGRLAGLAANRQELGLGGVDRHAPAPRGPASVCMLNGA